MTLLELLKPIQSTIVENWFNEVLSSFPPETVKFLKKNNKQFSNPIGHNLYQGVEALTNYLIDGGNQEKTVSALEEMIKIVALQEWSASQALSFMFDLKKVIINEVGQQIQDESLLSDWLKVESEIDILALNGFDLYMQAREKLYDIRANQMKDRTFRLLQQANFISDSPDAYQVSENCSCS